MLLVQLWSIEIWCEQLDSTERIYLLDFNIATGFTYHTFYWFDTDIYSI